MSPVLVDIFREIANNVNGAVLASLQTVNGNIVNVNYEPGVPKAINKKLEQWTNSETFEPKKYPLIGLIQPIDEVNGNNIGLAETGNIRIIICGLSQAEWDTTTRYENNFKPILYPVFDELLNQMFLSPYFLITDPNNISYTKRDWPFWDDGKDTNPFSDILDIIEINFKSLKINLTYC